MYLFRCAAEAGPQAFLKRYNTNISPLLPAGGGRCRLQHVEDLSWLGLFKELNVSTHKPSPFYHKRTRRKTHEECEHEYLKTPTFDNWQWEDAEILVLLQVMYTDLDFISTFNIELDVLQQFLYEVYKRYNNIPFHNFKHCFCVTQMMYGLIWLTDLRSKTDDMDLLIMLTSAVCHDLDHRGYNSAYQINGRTELALRYNDISPLENHHCAVAFEILEKTESNIFRNLTTEQYKRRRERIIKCILATDMSRHTEILNKFKTILPMFDFSAKYHRDVVRADSFSDMEKLGLPVTPFMDRHKVTKPSSQTAFICFVLFPRFIELTNLFPCLEIIDPVRKALDYYTEMENALDREKYNRTQSEKTAKPKEGAMTKESEVSLEPGPAVKPKQLVVYTGAVLSQVPVIVGHSVQIGCNR
uniref:Si:dkey-219c10.4 n=1 Tax=Electrophorus electricus TaxID=8005 RepID=A0A4W4FJ27_ELEEL